MTALPGGGHSSDLTRLHRKAQAALLEVILPDEDPLVVIYGAGGSAIVGTDRRAFVFKTGIKAGAPFGYRLKPFEYELVMKVRLHRGPGTSVVVIHAPLKIASCSSYWADARDDPWKARNAIPVEFADRDVEAGTAALGERVAEFQHAHERPAEPAERSPEDSAASGPPQPDAPAEPDDLPRPVELKPRNERIQKRTTRPPGPGAQDCPRCGAVLRVSWQFCPRCGAPAAAPSLQGRRSRFFTWS